MTPHNEASKEDIAKIVIMPGDPLRAKYIAEHFLENVKLVNSIRNIFAYTGTYQGKRITVMASGMGMPSIGIYCYELYHFYDVETIIRIGTCGTFVPEVKVLDTILATSSYTEGNFALAMHNEICHFVQSDTSVNDTIRKTASAHNISLVEGTMLCNEYFDPYMPDLQILLDRLPADKKILGSEMEAFALFYTANVLHKKAACLLSVVDSKFENKALSAEERQTSLDTMILLALDSSLSL